ncbi:MAG TPA: M28 family peptidase [Planctomycetota bacterium]|nr:M28 family peptidase [Planctomycetota bacterium]
MMQVFPARARWLVLLSLLPLCCCGGNSGPVDGKAALAHVERLVGFGPRPAGSAELGKATDYLVAELQKLGLQPQRQEFTPDGEQIGLRNVWVQIDGEDPQHGPILCLGAHYDTKLADGKDGRPPIRFVGAIDGGGAPAVLLELAQVLVKQRQPKVNVWLLFLDGEESIAWEWNDKRALLGSRYFVATMNQDKARFPAGLKARLQAFVLLDLIGDKNIKIDRDGNSNPALQKIFEQAAQAIGESARMYRHPTSQEIAQATQRGSNWGTIDDHMSFANFGIPSVLLIDFALRIPPSLQKVPRGQQPETDPAYAQWWHTAADDLDKMSAAALAFTGYLVVQALPELEAFCRKK